MALELKKLVPWNWFKHEENQAGTVPVQRNQTLSTYADSPLSQFHREVDRLFNNLVSGFGMPGLFEAFANMPSQVQPSWLKPSVDIAATDKQYTITVEVPGVEENDIALELLDDSLLIRGEKKLEKEEKDKEFYRVERSYGSFRRVLSLPEDADRDSIDARFSNGVLTINLPRKAATQISGRRIEIKKAA